MRQIKFRAFDKKAGKWLFGYEYPNLGGFSLIGEVTLMGELNTVKLEDWEHVEIMQYTGLRDKNGKEIYEGDIATDKEDNTTGPIRTHPGYYSFYGCVLGADNLDQDNILLEIIGNIHENPDLLDT